MAKKTTEFTRETRKIARERVSKIRKEILAEIDRLLRSGAVDPDHHHRGVLIGVAIENMADRWLMGERKKTDYKNLKHF